MKSQIVAGYQIRLIDFKKFCEMIVIPKNASESVILGVCDPICSWNTGIWKLSPIEGKLIVEKTITDSPNVIVDDFQLSRLISGLSSTQTLQRVGTLDCSQETAKKLEVIFPPDNLFVYDREFSYRKNWD